MYNKSAGVYQIRNIINNKVYIGGTLDLRERYVNHNSELRYGRHHSIKLQNSYNKYGTSNFTFEVLEICEPDWKIIIEKENYYLSKIGKADEFIRGENKLFYELTYNIKPYAQRGFFGKHSIETIEKMIKNNPNRRNVICYKDGNLIAKYISSQEAAINTNLTRGCVITLCKKKTFISRKGYMFCFEEDLELMLQNLDKKYTIYNKGIKYTQEKIKQINEKRSNVIKIKVTELDSGKELIFDSQKEVSKCYNIQPYLICVYLKKNKIHKKKQLKFSYNKDIV